MSNSSSCDSSSDDAAKTLAVESPESPEAANAYHKLLLPECEKIFTELNNSQRWDKSYVHAKYKHIYALRNAICGASGGVTRGLVHTKYHFAALYLFAKELELEPPQCLLADTFKVASDECTRLNIACGKDDYATIFRSQAEQSQRSPKARQWPPTTALEKNWSNVRFFIHINHCIAKLVSCRSNASFERKLRWDVRRSRFWAHFVFV